MHMWELSSLFSVTRFWNHSSKGSDNTFSLLWGLKLWQAERAHGIFPEYKAFIKAGLDWSRTLTAPYKIFCHGTAWRGMAGLPDWLVSLLGQHSFEIKISPLHNNMTLCIIIKNYHIKHYNGLVYTYLRYTYMDYCYKILNSDRIAFVMLFSKNWQVLMLDHLITKLYEDICLHHYANQ